MSRSRSSSEEAFFKSKLPCSLCGKSAKTNAYCFKCKETICLSHSTQLPPNPERICDSCFDLHLRSELPDTATVIEAIEDEIQRIGAEREQMTQEICKLSSSFQKQKEEMIKTQEAHSQQDKELNEKAVKNKEILKKVEEDIAKKKKEIDKNKQALEHAREKMQETEEMLGKSQVEMNKLTIDRNGILAELTELKDFLKMQVPIRLIKKIVCTSCYGRVQPEYYRMFKPESSRTPAQSKSSLVPPKKTGVCISCCIG